MHYPWWYVPVLTAPMLIAAISVVHMLVSHYAVGGGLFLAVETAHAYKTKNAPYLDYLRQHAWFFVLITVVFGAITGVGIWWTIALASPLATEMLIHTFVFGWAIEYVFFVIEIASAFIFYYYWGRLSAKVHTQIGWIYGLAAWISLVLITGITGFMLHNGAWSLKNPSFWAGFLNPQFLPQVLARTGGALLLSSLYVYFHAAFKVKDPALRNMIEYRSSRPALLGAVTIVLGGGWWYLALPVSAKAALVTAAPLNILMALLFALTAAVFVMLYFGPYRNPGWLSPGFAILFLACGFAAVATGEFVREAVRKPYIVYNVVLGNQVLAGEVSELRRRGVLESGTWTRAQVAQIAPGAVRGATVAEDVLTMQPESTQLELGRTIFMHQCNNCHAEKIGYSAVAHLLQGWTTAAVGDVARHPERVRYFMPPWCGTEEEAVLLTKYLDSIKEPGPWATMNFGDAKVGE